MRFISEKLLGPALIVIVLVFAVSACVPMKQQDQRWYTGGTVPDGYHVADRYDPSFTTAGWTMLLTGYLMTVVPAIIASETGDDSAIGFLIPVVGPVATLHYDSDTMNNGGGRQYVLAYTSVATQLMGLLLLSRGYSDARPVLVQD